MSGANPLEVVAGLLIVFFLPGYVVTKALFPEWRIRGAARLRRLIEVVTLSFLLSVVLTVLVGYFELTFAPGGFRAYWTDPVLEVSLLAIALVAVVLGWFRGAYRVEPPTGTPSTPHPGDEGAFELTHRLDLLAREERRIRHALRASSPDPTERSRLEARLEDMANETLELERRREAEYAD